MRTTWNFYSAGQLVFGRGAAGRLGELVARLGIDRVLVITDKVLAGVGIVERVHAPLAEANITVDLFDGGEAEPSLEAAGRAIDHARRFRPQAVLGLGGGSNMDLAKLTAAVAKHGGTPADYFSYDNIPGPVLPVIGVPTTAGTGSEVSHAAVLTDTANQIKVSTLSPYLRPALAVVDPELTLSCPKSVTADSGIDALTHAIEAYTAVDYSRLDVRPGESTPYDGRHPLGDCLAERAIELVGRYLVTVVRESANLAAREGMALAATLAGMAFSNCGVALVHALEYPIGGTLHCSHGAGNGMLLPYVMRFNLPERTAALARVASLLGEDTSGMDQQQAARQAIVAVERLKRDIGIPERISHIGGTADQLPVFSKKAFTIKRLLSINPRPASQEDLLAILQAAF